MVVFDFDGTLVLSNQLKYNAFFDLFPADECCQWIVKRVLGRILESSRFVILEEILKEIKEECSAKIDSTVEQLAQQYNDIVLDGAKKCPERQGAGQVLEALSSTNLIYISSNTPETALREIVEFRQWTQYVKGVFGYPKDKYRTLTELMALEKKKPSQLLVVGDGESDKRSADLAGCHFFSVQPQTNLLDLLKIIL